MIDLGKDYGVHNHIHFFGDNNYKNIVYYFPNKLEFAKNDKGEPHMLFQYFVKEKSVGAEDLYNSAGSILEATVRCSVKADDLDNGLKAVKKEFGLSDVKPVPFDDWKSGTAKFVILDAADDDTNSGGEKTEGSFVKRIIGTATPSIGTGGDLQCVFHSRLGPEGTELMKSRLEEGKGSLVSIEYDLEYKAVRPSVQMRITADLSRCQETAQHDLGIDFKMNYYVDLTLGAQLEWLTKKMEENGSIVVEKFVDAETPEQEKAANDLVKEFKDAVISELFAPFDDMDSKVSLTSDPQKSSQENFAKQGVDLLKLAGKGNEKKEDKKEEKPGEKKDVKPGDNADEKPEEKPDEVPADQQFAQKFHVGITYRMKQEKISLNRKIVVDYREQSTTVKPFHFNDSLDLIADKDVDLKKCIMPEILGDLFKMQSVTVQFIHDFTDKEDGLLNADVCIWRAKDGVMPQWAGKRFAFPDKVSPLETFHFNDTQNAPQSINWVAKDEQDIGYYYQVHLGYSASQKHASSPVDVFSQPVLSYGTELQLRPEQIVFQRIYPIRLGDLSFENVSQADVTLVLHPGTDKQSEEVFHLFKDDPSTSFTLRGEDTTRIPLMVKKMFVLKDRRKIHLEPYMQDEDEIILNDPIVDKDFKFRVTGLQDDMKELLFSFVTHSDQTEKELESTFDIDLKKNSDSNHVVTVPIISPDDVITYTAIVVKDDGDHELPDGVFSAGSNGRIPIDLSLIDKKRYTIQWEGKSPEDCGLELMKVSFQDADGNLLEQAAFAGPSVPEPKDVFVDAKLLSRVILRQERTNGASDEFEVVPDSNGIIVVKP